MSKPIVSKFQPFQWPLPTTMDCMDRDLAVELEAAAGMAEYQIAIPRVVQAQVR